MKKDSTVLNFILGVILMLLLAFAAKAQGKNYKSKSITNQVTKNKKSISADEAKVLYEEKYGKQNPEKRKSYSRKDIEETIIQPEDGIKYKTVINENNDTAIPETYNKPKAIYKGPANKPTEKEPVLKTIVTKPKELVFIEHIDVNISNN